ncbi:hypothetical protein SAY86_026619 [Trapa natans]|uniref:Uncharacterized protein n=1 Tax=Trapa natans TaxID=22666 RepID=A0AAN7QF23_TRANT|nr:hypothetical protein SAY86_026619 [Trapa natans]
MLELYEQNRMPPQGSEVDGSIGGGGSVHQTSSKVSSSHEDQASRQLSSRAPPDHSIVENHGALPKTMPNQGKEHGSVDMGSVITDHKVDSEPKDDIQIHHLEHLPGREMRNRSKERGEGEVHHERNARRNDPLEGGEWMEDGVSQKPGNVFGRAAELREGPVGQSPKEPIKIDKDKVKAALEKRRKVRAETVKKKDVMDEDDLIERELEDGIELAAVDEKRRERRLSWPKNERSTDNGKEHDLIGDEKAVKGHLPRRSEVENPEEGEMFAEASPMPNSCKRRGSPLEILTEGKKWHNYPFNGEDGHRTAGANYADKDYIRHEQRE